MNDEVRATSDKPKWLPAMGLEMCDGKTWPHFFSNERGGNSYIHRLALIDSLYRSAVRLQPLGGVWGETRSCESALRA